LLHRYQEHGIEGLEDRKPTPTIVWSQIADGHRDAIIDLGLCWVSSGCCFTGLSSNLTTRYKSEKILTAINTVKNK